MATKAIVVVVIFPYFQVLKCLKEVERCTKNIRLQLEWNEWYTDVQREWGQLARVVERLLMILFVVGTALFAVLCTLLAVPMPIVHNLSNTSTGVVRDPIIN